MAKADPKNTHSIAPIQEVADALARYVEENSDAQGTPTPPANKHLDDLEHILCTFAKGRNLDDRKLQAKVIRAKLVRRIGYRRSDYARWLHYGRFVDENSDLRLGFLIRLTRLKGHGSRSRAAAIEEAAAIKNIDQLNGIERRAVDLLKGARPKPLKKKTEELAIRLAKATKEKFFSPQRAGRPKGKKARSAAEAEEEMRGQFEALKPQLPLSDLVSIAAPIIEEFARCKIVRRNNTFMALWHIVCAYSETPQREKTVQETLSRVRGELKNTRPRGGTVQSYVYGRHVSLSLPRRVVKLQPHGVNATDARPITRQK